MHILLFYKFAVIENPQKFRDWLLGVCEDIELKGRILVAEEGLNPAGLPTEMAVALPTALE